MLTFPKYDSYVDSGIEWAGQIPSHWDLLPIRAVYQERKERNTGPKTDFVLSVMKDRGIIPYDEKGNVGNKKSENIENYKVVYPGDLVINKMNAIIGSLGISAYHGALSQVYFVLYPRDKRRHNHQFLGYLFQVKPFQTSLIRIAKGIMELRESIEFDEFKKLPLPLPSRVEQDRIVAFLDEKTREIDDAIAKKRRLIALLQEQKAILINEAVTKGLNRGVAMKESGVEWIGRIPAHWRTKMLKFVFQSMDYGLSERAKSDGQYKYLNMGHVQDGRVIVEDTGYLDHAPKSLLLEDGDILFNRTNSFDLVGKSGIYKANGMTENVTFASYLVRLRVARGYAADWANYLLSAHSFLAFIRTLALRSLNQANLNPTRLGSVHVPIPPNEEQISIVNHLESSLAIHDKQILLAVQTIDRYVELKRTLIADAVTGKIRV